MVLRILSAVVAVLGLGAGIAGAIGVKDTPESTVTAASSVDTPVVVIGPQIFEIDGLEEITVVGPGALDIYQGRPADAYPWLREADSTIVRGVLSWEELDVFVPALYSGTDVEPSEDIWRSIESGIGTVSFSADDVITGAVVVLVTRDGTEFTEVSAVLNRDPGYAWAWPTLSAGAGLQALGLAGLAVSWLRPRQQSKTTTDKAATTTDKAATTKAKAATTKAKPTKAKTTTAKAKTTTAKAKTKAKTSTAKTKPTTSAAEKKTTKEIES